MKRMLSGIKPSGELTLGNYLGALKRFVAFQEDYEMFVFVANLHCITNYQDPKQLNKHLKNAVSLFLACGLDPDRSTIFLQTDVPEHAQLGFILSCYSYLGELNRMTQFKDKASKSDSSLTVGFYTYPTLMAADILMYDPAYIPVGDDQKQHVELTRDLAERFNHRYTPTFTIPEPLIAKTGARIMSLSDPNKKMSKSDHSDKGVIFMLDDPITIRKKVKSATTDSLAKITFDPINQPGISNLIQIMATCLEQSIEEVVVVYKNAKYGEFKEAVAQVIIDTLTPIQERYREIIQTDILERVLVKGKEKAQKIAQQKLEKVQREIGLEIKTK